MTGPVNLRPRSTWQVVNITSAERVGRVAIGAAAVAVAVTLLVSASSLVAVLLEVLLVLAGLDMIVTGATGHCPLYQRLGRAPIPSGGTP